MPDTLCHIEVGRHRGMPVARLAGEIDISNVDHVAQELEAAAGKESVLVVDLSRTEYFDSAGIRLLFTIAMRLKMRRQELHVVVPPDAFIRRLLEITDFMRAFPVHDSIESVPGTPAN